MTLVTALKSPDFKEMVEKRMLDERGTNQNAELDRITTGFPQDLVPSVENRQCNEGPVHPELLKLMNEDHVLQRRELHKIQERLDKSA